MRRARELRQRAAARPRRRRSRRVIDRLRAFLRPAAARRDRPRLFALAVAAIVLGAAGCWRCSTTRRRRRPAPRARPTARAGDRGPTAESWPLPAAARERPSEEGRDTAARADSRADVDAAKRAARRFLTGYLPYIYGRPTRDRIDATTASCGAGSRATRRASRPAVRDRRPRVLLVHADGARPGRVPRCVALVADGARRYTVRLELERDAAGWLVADVGS